MCGKDALTVLLYGLTFIAIIGAIAIASITGNS